MEHNHEPSGMVSGESSPIEYLKLVVVILFITAVAWLINRGGIADYLRWFMGVFFVVFASFKFVGYRMFTLMFAGYDVIAKRIRIYSYAYPFIELGLGLLYLFNVVAAPRDLITVAIMGIGTIGVAEEIKKRSGIHCACLGNVIKLPLSTVSLIEDAGMGLMAVVLFIRF